MSQSPQEVTQLLIAWANGDELAAERLMPLVDRELRRLAHQYMRRERAGHTLQTSALVNEAYIRLIDAKAVQWQDRAHFFGLAAHLMRRVLVDYARHQGSAKRGGGVRPLPLDEALHLSDERAADVIALDEALKALAGVDPRKSRLVELRFFSGLTIEEAAAVLKVSPGTAMRDWTLAKAWLRREMAGNGHV